MLDPFTKPLSLAKFSDAASTIRSWLSKNRKFDTNGIESINERIAATGALMASKTEDK